jgi:hypothetical protein
MYLIETKKEYVGDHYVQSQGQHQGALRTLQDVELLDLVALPLSIDTILGDYSGNYILPEEKVIMRVAGFLPNDDTKIPSEPSKALHQMQ